MAIGCRGSSPLLGTIFQEGPLDAGLFVAGVSIDPA